MTQTQYVLQPSQEREGYWVLTDTANNIVCVFKEGDFNDDQKFALLDSDADVLKRIGPQGIAKAVRQMGDWLAAYHYELVFGTPIPARFAIGRQIAYLRQSQCLTQGLLADLTGLNNANISKIEAGKYNASVDIIERIAKALGAELTLN